MILYGRHWVRQRGFSENASPGPSPLLVRLCCRRAASHRPCLAAPAPTMVLGRTPPAVGAQAKQRQFRLCLAHHGADEAVAVVHGAPGGYADGDDLTVLVAAAQHEVSNCLSHLFHHPGVGPPRDDPGTWGSERGLGKAILAHGNLLASSSMAAGRAGPQRCSTQRRCFPAHYCAMPWQRRRCLLQYSVAPLSPALCEPNEQEQSFPGGGSPDRPPAPAWHLHSSPPTESWPEGRSLSHLTVRPSASLTGGLGHFD